MVAPALAEHLPAVADRPGPARSPSGADAAPRLRSLDVLRGGAVVGMLFVNNPGVRAAVPTQLRHAHSGGLHAADLVFPLFLFVAGVGMGLSRRAVAPRAMLRRVALLVLIGCLLVSAKYRHLSPSTGVLQHIAIATAAAWAVLRLPRRVQPWLWGGGLLAAWAAPTWLSLPGTRAGSWEAGTTLSAAAERLLTGHVGREQVIASLVSSLTVLLGVAAGRTLSALPGLAGVRRLLVAGAVGIAAGLALSRSVPLDKTLWTPSYVLVTGGLCAALLAAAVGLLDLGGWTPLAEPLRVLGVNAIAVYVATTLLYSAVLPPWRPRLVHPLRELLGARGATIGYAASSVLLAWGLSAWLWRRSVVLKL